MRFVSVNDIGQLKRNEFSIGSGLYDESGGGGKAHRSMQKAPVVFDRRGLQADMLAGFESVVFELIIFDSN